MSYAVPTWKDLCPEDDDPGSYLAGVKRLYGADPVQLALEHMWAVGWNPNGEVQTTAERVRAFRAYLSKASQGIRDNASRKA